ncbi:lysine-specific demethylase 5B-B [Salmo salar]|uniref:[histone H3]-trimethyl-L-lysine(4) demethylase n=1 Tax=Salmo salar TaxID=8030 RepID=A0A1S3LB02_SALSA|nr:lysine-specific demethylase 5B-B [Salmo salar]XP_013988015.1 lysine-specific demethylase 5B-B [Salmo salar]XP_013988016.1 lysine-specific demethylase 5B-B [Salmo salar]|eukprot:XP_013988014.1 PREDICTED: lysine-specific demethylase 5B-B-like [Salmo salar]
MTQPRTNEFIAPPECPVFEPSWEEFADPFTYINKIRPIAEKTGICKVRPPKGWQPPFACDVDSLHFTPRIQRLNELEAQTRVKLNFLDQIAKFWELQGCTLKIPHVERKILDLYQLNKLVNNERGFDAVCRERRWSKIALKMGFAPGKAIGSHLRSHYERILYPYNLFQTGANLLKPTLTNDTKDTDYIPHDLPQRQSVQPLETCSIARRAKRMRAEEGCMKTVTEEDCENRPNLRRRMGSYVAKPEPQAVKVLPVQVKQEATEHEEPITSDKENVPTKKNDPTVDQYMCLVCGSGSEENRLLLCDGCDDSYHTFCLIPPLHDVPKGDWRCPKCLAQECCKPQVAFGFEQAGRDYSLRTFGDMADSFKSDYFNMPVHMVPTELVEKEFWRLVSTIEEDVTVEYGADIASKEFGSGFPIRGGRFQVSPEDEDYLSSGWNLNNMPVMDSSVLTHITADICGMKLPWLYVGMCFSSFCWHIEDHWSYSINYLHWGEPKTWYGVPGYAAEKLEWVMRKLAPELFESQPDLLHQLVTIMNPNTLMNHGVPVYRTNQCSGEFVITFPRAYHSGFNQGFNFAEAVNFCTMDWMPMGRMCVDHYRQLNRYCVFSHDEMVCKMASKADTTMDVALASAVQRDMTVMLQEEDKLRDKVSKMGVQRSQQAEYDLLPDEERQCSKCRTTCYLSALTCPCSPGQLVCLHHAHDLCSCTSSKLTLNYRFTMAELYPMMEAVTLRAESYTYWVSHVSDILEAKQDKKSGLEELRSLVVEAEVKRFPQSDLLRQLRTVTLDAEKCAVVAQQLLIGKRQTRYRSGGRKSQSQNLLTVEELRSFVRQLHNLPCSIRQAPLLKDLLTRVDDFQQSSEQLLSDEAPSPAALQGLLDVSLGLDVELPQLALLRERLEQARWLDGVKGASVRPHSLCLDTMRRLIDQGVGLAPHGSVERAMARLQELLTMSEHWEERALRLMEARPRHCVETLVEALQEVASIPAYLPNCLLLKDTVDQAKDWLQEAETLQLGGRIPVLDTLTELVSRAKAIPVWLDPLARLDSLVFDVQAWKESAAKTFLMKNSTYSLLEVLCPRCEAGTGPQKSKYKRAKDAAQCSERNSARLDCLSDVERALSESKDSASAMATLAEVRQKEMESLLALRASNESKLLLAGDCGALRVCVCHKAPSGAMLQCELCRDAFHRSCVLGSNQDPLPNQAWVCPQCQLSEKPPLDRVLPLLASLQRIRVRLPEGDALRFLIERTVRWQHRVQQASAEVGQGVAVTTSHQRWASSSPTWAPSPTQETNSMSFYTEHQCIPLQGLSPELEELMVEGFLLQVTLPETQQLYRSLLIKLDPRHHHHTDSPFPQDSAEQDQHQHNSQGGSPPHNQNGVACPKKEAVNGKRTKRHMEEEGSERKDKAKKPRKKKPKLNKERSQEAKGTCSPTATHSDLSLSDSDEDFTLCAAPWCREPEGKQVNWVQCDGSCQQWFHQVCVGVSAEQAEKEDYICISCTQPDHTRE